MAIKVKAVERKLMVGPKAGQYVHILRSATGFNLLKMINQIFLRAYPLYFHEMAVEGGNGIETTRSGKVQYRASAVSRQVVYYVTSPFYSVLVYIVMKRDVQSVVQII